MKTIQLKNGFKTSVDDADFYELNKHKWYANKSRDVVYVKRATKMTDGRKEKLIFMHRQIMGFPDKMVVDHINHDTLDNRRCNLRICTNKENFHNRKRRTESKSGYQGVTWYKKLKKWRASIYLTIGYFDSKEDASKAYDEMAKKFFGEFACLNYPEKKRM